MSNCAGIKYSDLKWCDGKVNLPGIRPEVYCVAKRDIVQWPTLASSVTTTMGEIATYTGSFVLAASAVFQQIGIIDFRSGVNSEPQGTRPSKSFLTTGTFVYAGVDENATGFARQANNDDLVYAFRQKDGKFRIIGNEMYQTDTAVAQSLGSQPTDEMGTTLTVTVTDVCPAPFYTGEIVTIDGTINPAPEPPVQG